MNNGFLPEDYEVPVKVGNYMKLEDGENRFRVLTPAITGYEYWVDENGNVRAKDAKPQKGDKPERIRKTELDSGESTIPVAAAETMRHFWAFVVWNYKHEKIQIYEITQTTIQKAITAYVKNKKWGSPLEYDIVITKTKTGPNPTDVEYTLLAEPKEEPEEKILTTHLATYVNLDALFDGEDPFKNPTE
jgi:hypothetical protein